MSQMMGWEFEGGFSSQEMGALIFPLMGEKGRRGGSAFKRRNEFQTIPKKKKKNS